MTEVQINNLTRTFTEGGVRAVDDLTLTIPEGDLVVLLGPSGCGKTTLLRCLAGLERPDFGNISFAGETMFGNNGKTDIPAHKRGIGMVFQNYALWPHMTVTQNVAFPLRAQGVKKADRGRQAADALALVECEALGDRIPAAISGGQQQRVALARALVAEPRLLLFDEPLSNLDYRLRAQLRREIRNLHRKLGFTGVYVTHDQTEAMQLGSLVAVLKDGRVEQLEEPTKLFAHPASSYVARFLGISNRVPLRRDVNGWKIGEQGTQFAIPDMKLPAEHYELYLRSSDLELNSENHESSDPDATRLAGVVEDVLFSGDITEWLVRIGSSTITVTAGAGTWPYVAGDRVSVFFPMPSALIYEAGDSGKIIRHERLHEQLLSR